MKRSELVVGQEYYHDSSPAWSNPKSYLLAERYVVVHTGNWSDDGFFGHSSSVKTQPLLDREARPVLVAGRLNPVQVLLPANIRSASGRALRGRTGVLAVELDAQTGHPKRVSEGQTVRAVVVQLSALRGPWEETDAKVRGIRAEWLEMRSAQARRQQEEWARAKSLAARATALGFTGVSAGSEDVRIKPQAFEAMLDEVEAARTGIASISEPLAVAAHREVARTVSVYPEVPDCDSEGSPS